ncbi:MAG: CbiX/SirB N-terminal domain-containing protein [Azonexus sp.]
MTTALVLFGHGARDPEWAGSVRRVQDAIRKRAPGLAVELAFLEFLTPRLPDCVAGLIADGASKIVVMPMFIAPGGHLKREVPEMLDLLRSTHPGVQFFLGEAIGQNEIVVQAMAEATLQAAGSELA